MMIDSLVSPPSRQRNHWSRNLLLALAVSIGLSAKAQVATITFAQPDDGAFVIATSHGATPILVENSSPDTVKLAATCFGEDVQRVTGQNPTRLETLPSTPPQNIILVGVVGNSPLLDSLDRSGKLPLGSLRGTWENAITAVVDQPFPGVDHALVIAGSDRRGAAFAMFTLSRRMGISPWTWWADVPVLHHDAVFLAAGTHEQQATPSVQYRGIFLNDEDWGLRPWAAKKMDPKLGNIGPNTYARVLELLLRLHANSLWPAMHPGTLAFNALPENAKLADQWGIVMGSSHSEALLRNNVGEWDEKRDGPWNYQLNRAAIDTYWKKRLIENGKYENFYTVGMRGVHDTGLEATGSNEVKARLVEQVMTDQRQMLTGHVAPDVRSVPQVLWLYKESLELYRAGMRVPDDVTLGWTDDNFGYIRQLPNVDEQKRAGGSGIYYHVSYWGRPHDYLWLCTTPPALMHEELTKAFDHHARRYWILNVGDLKPAESDMDYFMQLAWNEPETAKLDQHTFLTRWFSEQFPTINAEAVATLMDTYYKLNFIRKPEHMGFNGYDDDIQRTAFNPLAWGDQNRTRLKAVQAMEAQGNSLAAQVTPAYRNAFFELVQYPVQVAGSQNEKFLDADRSFLDASQHHDPAAAATQAQGAYNRIQTLTSQYNSLQNGKWDGMMSSSPRERHVFAMPSVATSAGTSVPPLPVSWSAGTATENAAGTGFVERNGTISINATHFSANSDSASTAVSAKWHVLPELGISTGGSVEFGLPGILAELPSLKSPTPVSPFLEYSFTSASGPDALLTLWLLPTFPVDSLHSLRFGVSLDGATPHVLDAGGAGEWQDDGRAPIWEGNVLRNGNLLTLNLGPLAAGVHHLRLIYLDPGIVFEHLVITRPGAPPAYPVPPETLSSAFQSH